MPLPTQGNLHVDRLLSNISIAYQNLDYIADQLFPIVPVTKQSNVFASFNQSYWFRDLAEVRAPGTQARTTGYKVVTSNQYICQPYAIAHPIPDEVRSNADEVFSVDREATNLVTDKILMSRERKFVTDFFTTSVWGNDKTGGTDFTQWNDYAGSQPLVDVEGWKETIEGLIGREPGHLAMGRQVWTKLKWHPDLIDTVKYTQKGVVSEDLVASLFGVKKILIGRAIYTATAEGTAEASVTYSRIWGKHILLLFRPDAGSLMTPSGGYTFVWNRPGSPGLFTTYRYREERARTDFIEAESFYDQKLTAANAGLFASGVIA